MCLAITKPPGVLVPEEYLRNAYRQHDDGFGIAVINSGQICVHKGLLSLDFILKLCGQAKESPALIHFRYATHGTITKQNCHPFRLNPNLVVVHNGVMSVKTTAPESDTAAFSRWIRRQLPQYNGDPTHPDILKEQSKFLGCSKLAYMNHQGVFSYVNKFQGTEDKDGIWYSNYSHLDSGTHYPNQSYGGPIKCYTPHLKYSDPGYQDEYGWRGEDGKWNHWSLTGGVSRYNDHIFDEDATAPVHLGLVGPQSPASHSSRTQSHPIINYHRPFIPPMYPGPWFLVPYIGRILTASLYESYWQSGASPRMRAMRAVEARKIIDSYKKHMLKTGYVPPLTDNAAVCAFNIATYAVRERLFIEHAIQMGTAPGGGTVDLDLLEDKEWVEEKLKREESARRVAEYLAAKERDDKKEGDDGPEKIQTRCPQCNEWVDIENMRTWHAAEACLTCISEFNKAQLEDWGNATIKGGRPQTPTKATKLNPTKVEVPLLCGGTMATTTPRKPIDTISPLADQVSEMIATEKGPLPVATSPSSLNLK